MPAACTNCPTPPWWCSGASGRPAPTAETAARYFLPRRFYDLGHAVMQLDGEHDLFGDGSVTCLPSYGHTPATSRCGCAAPRATTSWWPTPATIARVAESRAFPDYSDHAAMNRSLDSLLALREPRTVMVFGHDPTQWGEAAILPAAR